MQIVPLFLFVLAIVLFMVASFISPTEPNPWRNRLVCFGLVCFAAAELFGKGIK
jgi:hypothetical protein